MYRIDEKKGTVEQIWEYGKKRGHELYSAITSSVEYQADHDSIEKDYSMHIPPKHSATL